MSGSDDSGISPWAFAAGALVLFVVVGTIIWFAIPGADANHRFVSPSGKRAVELGELCREGNCRRVAVTEAITTDGTRKRLGCDLPLTETRPVLLNAHPLWAADETSVDIVYADADGLGGRFTIDLDRDCTRAE